MSTPELTVNSAHSCLDNIYSLRALEAFNLIKPKGVTKSQEYIRKLASVLL